MSWRTALNSLANISVAGVQTSYDLDALPGLIPAADLPALLPDFPVGGGPGGENTPALAALTYDGTAWLAVLHVDHVLLWTPVGTDAGLPGVLPALLDAVDAYLAALSADGTLGGALHEPLALLRVQIEVIALGGVRYHGARFRHRWVQVVEAPGG